MDPSTAAELVRSFKALSDNMFVSQTLLDKRQTFDGSSSDALTKWLQEMDDIYVALKCDDGNTLYAATRSLKGTALNFF